MCDENGKKKYIYNSENTYQFKKDMNFRKFDFLITLILLSVPSIILVYLYSKQG